MARAASPTRGRAISSCAPRRSSRCRRRSRRWWASAPRRARAPRRGSARRARRRHRDGLRGDRRAGLPLRRARPVTSAALVHVVVSGLATGSIYALVALSLVIVYNATRTLNFAQGEMLMVSAFVAWSAQRAGGLPLPLAFACGVVAGGVLAYVVERVVIRRAVSATHWDVLIITLGLSLVLRAGAGMVWTNDELPFPSLFSNRPMSFGPG